VEIPLVFIIGTAIAILGLIWNLKGRSNQGGELGRDWKTFKEAAEQNKILEVIRIGEDLCYNVHLTKEQLEQISVYTEKNISAFPELEKLKIAVMNKKIRWQRKDTSRMFRFI
jgi:hypothetical protein